MSDETERQAKSRQFIAAMRARPGNTMREDGSNPLLDDISFGPVVERCFCSAGLGAWKHDEDCPAALPSSPPAQDET